ncbi:Imm32 family immunity protein [Chitinolyticbacter albus]|uniref:Imm32 family immunity protein n=1 Tax=Chitinolyticbacter albus TaxID=2961951 RepID=UPI00210E2D41|nr:hypothetical protein [Chitinolyticbacter albus]
MQISGYFESSADSTTQREPRQLAEVTLVANAAELRLIASFLIQCAQGIEMRGMKWEHEHLSDRHPQFESSPHFVVFNDAKLERQR